MDHETLVRNYYDRVVDIEDARLDWAAFEMPVTMHYLQRYIPPGSRMLDIACGTGRYDEKLLGAGYRVGLNDLSPQNVRKTRERLQTGGGSSQVLFCRTGNGLDPDAWHGSPWDAVLMLGPIYHLPLYEDRLAILKQAYEHLDREGYLFVAFCSRVAAVWGGLARWPEGILRKDSVRRLMQSGQGFNFARNASDFESYYFCAVEEIRPLIARAGFDTLHIADMEGAFGGRMDRYHELDDPAVREAWMDFVLENAEEPVFQYASEHLLVVARPKPQNDTAINNGNSLPLRRR
ncbi:MAG: class I SAM-dependent methyltransferase [Armatimonadetes bacterium]|nr:class I SAM-dependent methyltransferase [Armatimonadota bacterium]